MRDVGVNAVRPQEPRWTHIALRVGDVDASIAWYQEFTPLELLDRRQDELGFGAWLGQPDSPDKPFILVLAQFLPETDPYSAYPREVLAPFAHFGVELPERGDIDAIAARGEAAGCLAMPPQQLPDPIGYVCMLRDPDGNMVEFSFDQGVYAKAREVWGDDGGTRSVTAASPSAVVRSYFAAFAGRDPVTIAGHVSEDFVNEHASALGTGCVGRAEYARRLPDFLELFPGLAYHVEQVIAAGTDVAVTYRLTATSDDRPVEVRGAMAFEVVDGLITRRTDYWDSLGYLRQIGAADADTG